MIFEKLFFFIFLTRYNIKTDNQGDNEWLSQSLDIFNQLICKLALYLTIIMVGLSTGQKTQ